MEIAIESLDKQPSYIILDRGLNENEKSCIMVENGKLKGMGYIPEDVQINDFKTLKDYIEPLKENQFLVNFLAGYAARNPSKIIFI